MSKLIEKLNDLRNIKQNVSLYFWLFKTLYIKGLGITGYIFILLQIFKIYFNLLQGIMYGWFSAQVIELILHEQDISFLVWPLIYMVVFYFIRHMVEIWYTYIVKKVDFLLDEYYQHTFNERTAITSPDQYEDSKFIQMREKLLYNKDLVLRANFQLVYFIGALFGFLFSFNILLTLPSYVYIFIFISVAANLYYEYKFDTHIWQIWDAEGEEKVKYDIYRNKIHGVSVNTALSNLVNKKYKLIIERTFDLLISFNRKILADDKRAFRWGILVEIIQIFTYIGTVLVVLSEALRRGSTEFFLTISPVATNIEGQIFNMFYYIKEIAAKKNIVQSYYDFLNNTETIKDTGINVWENNPEDNVLIEFQDVWFKYPSSKNWVIKGVSFKIHKKSQVAIIGKNGAGKTTIIKLILGLYKPQKGKIIINGVDITSNDISLVDYYTKVSLMAQGEAAWNIPFIENITISNYENVDDNRVKYAIKMADLDEFVDKRLKGDLSVWLDPGIEGGTQISGGESQKISIASHFYKDADLYIFDEPTSAVDVVSDKKIMNNFWNLMEDKTVIIISHRIKKITDADQIIVVYKGKIVDIGKHEELIERSDVYRELYLSVD